MSKFCQQCGVPILLNTGTDQLCEDCFQLKQRPDDLSKRKQMFGVPFEDMKHVDEDGRIKVIVDALKNNPGKLIGFMVDTGPAYQGKGDRYIEKLRAVLPNVKVVSRNPGPVKGCETIGFKL